MTVLAVLEAARQHGISIAVDGDNLRIHARHKPPPGMLAIIEAAKAEILAHLRAQEQRAHEQPVPLGGAASIVEMWRAGFGQLSAVREPCPGWRPGEWPRAHRIGSEFLRVSASPSWARIAAELNWSTEELFGCNRHTGVAALSISGAILAARTPVTRVLENAVWYADGFHRDRIVVDPELIPVWEFHKGGRHEQHQH
jgi:hypothetical protein